MSAAQSRAAGARRASLRREPPLPSGGARLAPRQRDRVVGDRPQAGDDPQAARRAARRRGRGDVAPRPRHAARARGRRTTASTSSSCSPATARSTRRPTGSLHTDTALAPLPGGSTNVYARTLGFSTDADRRDRTSCSRSLARGVDETHRRRPRQPPAVPVPHRHRLRRRGDPAGRALRRAEALLLASAPRRRRVRHLLPPRGNAHALRPRARHRRDRSTTSRFAIVSKTDPYTYLGRLPLHGRARGRASTARSRSPRSARSTPLTLLGGAASAMRSRPVPRAPPRASITATICTGIIVRSGEPFAYQVDGDDVGDTEQLDIEYEPDALDRRRSVDASRRRRSARSARARRARRRERW